MASSSDDTTERPRRYPHTDPEATSDLPTRADDTPSFDTAALDGKLRTPFFSERYDLQRELGRGGMGVVRQCHDHRLGRNVAVKVLPGHERDRGAQTAQAARFIHEARVQARVEHPAVVPIYDLGVDDQGEYFFTMKRIQGVTLKEVIAALTRSDADTTKRFSLRRLLEVFSQICLAVDYAHVAGVIHRDLKPSNIMLGDFGEVYVLDWGIAAILEQPGEDQTPTLVGTAVGGTPGYMAPEQVVGEASSFSPTSDVYGLGAILYELLTLQPLNEGATAVAKHAATMRGRYVPAARRAPDREVPPELDVICMRATASDPNQRYPSARQLHDAVQSYLDGDRDARLRAELADEHAHWASVAAERVREDPSDLETRQAVLAEVGRALALDPNNALARATMIDLMTLPPNTTPDAVAEAMQKRTTRERMTAGRIAAIAYASMLLYWPFFWWAGIRDIIPIISFTALTVASIVLVLYVARTGRATDGMLTLAATVSTLGLAATTFFYGPLILVPAAVATNAAAYTMMLRGRHRWFVIALACAVVGIPVLTEIAFGWPNAYGFADGAFIVVPQALGLAPGPTVLLLLLAGWGSILTATLCTSAIRDTLDVTERKLQIHLWHVRQLLGDDPAIEAVGLSTAHTRSTAAPARAAH